MDFKITYDGSCLKVTVTGKIDNDFLLHVNKCAQDKGFVYSSHHQIWNLLEVDASKLSLDVAAMLAADDKGISYTNPDASLALVYTDPQIHLITKEYLKLCENLKQPWRIRYFNNLAKACAWTCPTCKCKCSWETLKYLEKEC